MFTNLLMLHLQTTKLLRPKRFQHRDRCISVRLTLNPCCSDVEALISFIITSSGIYGNNASPMICPSFPSERSLLINCCLQNILDGQV